MIPPCDSREKCWRLGRIDPYHAYEHWLNFTPHPAQCQIKDGLKKNTTIVAGRRFGKSVFMAAELLRYALTNQDTIQYCIAPTMEQAKIIFGEIRRLIDRSPMVRNMVVSTHDFPFPDITLESGSVINARSVGNNGAKFLRGYKAHRIVMDEAELVKDSELQTIIEPMLADYADLDIGGWMIKIGTPLGRNHFYKSFQAGLENRPEYSSFRFTSFDNPHISHNYINSKRATIPDIQFRVEYLAEFVDDEICVFRWDSINDASKPYEEAFTPEKGKSYYVGVDIAKMFDYSCIVVMDGTDPKQCKVVYTERFTNKPYSFLIERILAISMQFSPVRILLDETGVGAGITEQIVAELSNAEGFKFSQQTKIALINTLKTGLEQRRIIFSEENLKLIEELHFFQYDYDQETTNLKKMEAAHGFHDDFVIALALAYQKCSVAYADAETLLIPQKPSDSKPLNTTDNSILLIQDMPVGESSDNLVVIT